MSNLTPDDVDLRLTASKAELSEEDQRLWLGLEDEKISRIAGDEANKQFTELVKQQNSGTESRLSTEVIHRSEGDVSNLNSLNAVAQALSDYRIKTDLEINNEVIARKALGVELNSRIDSFVSMWDHQKYLIYQAIQDVQDDLDGKYASMDTRIVKYEQMLSDITADSIQITTDNGEINMGAWTILSQAREWDLQIIGRMKDFQIKTEEDLNQALEDIQNSLPVEQDIIDKAIEALSNAPIIKELDAKIAGNIADIDTVHKDLLTEITTRQNEMVAQAQNTADELKKQSDALNATITAEANARIDAIEREATIRADQLNQEALERTAEIDQRIGELDLDIDADLEAVNKRIDAANNTITELNENLDRDVAAINDRVDDVNTKADGINASLEEQRVELAHSIEVISTKADAIKAESDQKILDLNTKADGIHDEVSAETAARIAAVTALNDGLTSEIQHRKDGDQVVTTALENYKSSNDTALANVRTELTANVTATTANATKIDALDVRLTTNEEETGEAKALAASATQKAETALTETSALASQMTTVNASIDGIKGDLAKKADAAAFNQLKAEVVEIDGKVLTNTQDLTALKTSVTGLDGKVTGNTSAISELSTQQVVQGDQITQLTSDTTALKNSLEGVEDDLATKVDSTAFNELSTKVDKNASDITVQAGSITKLQSDLVLTNQAVNTKANASALTTLDTKVATIDGKVTSNTTAITNLSNRVGVTEGAISKKADASALSSLDTKVTAIDGKVTTQGTSITKLQNDLTTTNQNVATKADATALSALSNTVTEQGGKITSNSSAITDLTNKVIIVEDDVAKKADATAVSSLSTKVGTLEGTVTSQGTAVTKLQNDLALTNTAVSKKAESSALNALDSKVTQQGNTITSQGGAITKLQNDVSSIDTELNSKASSAALSALDTKVTQQGGVLTSQGTAITKLENDLSTVNTELDTKADSAALNALDSKVTTIDGKVTSQGTSLTSLTNRVTKNEGDISKKAEATALTALTTRVTNAEGVNTSQGTAITKLTNDLATTNGKVDTKADATALTALDSKVTSVDGKVTTNSNAITTLSGRVTTTEKGLATKLDASVISGYYTKGQTDTKAAEIAAGKVEEFNAKLVIGGRNLYFGPNPVVLRSQTSEGRIVFPAIASGNTQRFNYLTNDNLDLSGLQVGDPTIASIEIFVPSTDTSDYTIQFGTYRFSGSSYVYAPTVDVKTLPKDTWIKLTTAPGTYTSGQPATGINLVFNLVGRKTAGDEIKWRNFMMEKASKASAFSESDKAVQTKIDANSTAIQNTNAEVTRVDGVATAANNAITALAGRVGIVEGAVSTKAEASAVNSLTTRVSAAEGNISSQGTQITKLQNDLVLTNATVETKASAAAVTALDNKVSQQGSDITSNSGLITKLQNDLNTTNVEVNKKANSTALAALDSKVTTIDGKVVSQGSQITKLENDLTTLGTTVGGKADSSALAALDSKVTQQGNTITSQGSAVTNLTSRVATNETNISKKADASALSTLDTKVTSIDGKVTTQGAAITKLQNDLVITDQKVETKADANALSTLSNKVEGIDGRVTANSSALSSLTNRVTTVEGDVTKKADSTAVNALTSRVETAEGQITSQGSAVTKLQNDLVITANTANAALPQITTAGAYKAFRNVLNYYIASSAIPVTTNLVISTPITFTAKMTNISIKGYMYKGSNTTIDLRVGFYAYNLSSFTQTSVTNNGSFPFKVRLAVKDEKVVIILSSATALTMAYPQFGVDAEFGYLLAPDAWKDGWSCAVVTEAGLDAYGVTNITTPPIFDPKTEITANATAIQTLDNKVTQNGTDIASISTAQTVLSNRIATVEGTLTNKADTSAVSQLDSRVTVAEGKITTNTASITNLTSRVTTTENNLTATNSAVSGLTTRVTATETGITNLASQNTALKAELSSGGAVNLGVAAFTDPQTLIQMYYGGHTPSLIPSELRTNGKAYNIRMTTSSGGNYIYMGVFNNNSEWRNAPLRVRTGKRYLISAYMKSDATPAQVSMQLRVFAGDGVTTGTLTGALVTTGSPTIYAALTDQLVKYTWVIPTIGLANAQTGTLLFRGNLLGTTPVNANIVIDNIMFEELVGDPVEGSPYVPGSADLFGIDASIKANATANTETRAEVTRIDGVVQTQATSITGLQTQIAGKADTSAVTSLTTRITAAEGNITSLSNQTTTLTNRMTAAEGNITATSNTLSTLNNKVTEIDGKVTAQGTALTKVESDLSGMVIGGANLWSLQATGIYYGGAVTAPHAQVTVVGNAVTFTNKGSSDRIGCNVPLTSGQPVTVRFKPVSGVVDGIVYMRALTSTGAQADSQKTAVATLKDGYYTAVLPSTQFPSTTASVNFGIGGAGTTTTVVSEITVQVGNTATTWTDSYRDIPEVDLSSYAKAAALTALDTKVTTIDGKVTAQASLITQLQTDVAGNSSKLIVQGEVVDGLKASYVVKTDVNGLVAGYGLYNTGSSSAFGVNADFFYVGKGTTAANGKKPFMVLTTPTTIGGVTYPAGTWIDVALIANATIGTAHIADASITNAKISSLDAAKITTGTLDAARIKVGAATQYEVGYDPITKARTFVAQPVTPYHIGDIWKNGNTTSICTVTRLTGAYVAADWGKTGDVTSLNTAADTSKVGGVAAATVNQNITNAQTAATNADSKAVAAQATANLANNQVNAWKFTGTTEIDGGKIRADTITAVQIDVAELSAISANLGTFTSTTPGGSTTISGKDITVRDPEGNVRVRIGIFI